MQFLGYPVGNINWDLQNNNIEQYTINRQLVASGTLARRYLLNFDVITNVNNLARDLDGHKNEHSTNKPFFIEVPQIIRTDLFADKFDSIQAGIVTDTTFNRRFTTMLDPGISRRFSSYYLRDQSLRYDNLIYQPSENANIDSGNANNDNPRFFFTGTLPQSLVGLKVRRIGEDVNDVYTIVSIFNANLRFDQYDNFDETGRDVIHGFTRYTIVTFDRLPPFDNDTSIMDAPLGWEAVNETSITSDFQISSRGKIITVLETTNTFMPSQADLENAKGRYITFDTHPKVYLINRIEKDSVNSMLFRITLTLPYMHRSQPMRINFKPMMKVRYAPGSLTTNVTGGIITRDRISVIEDI